MSRVDLTDKLFPLLERANLTSIAPQTRLFEDTERDHQGNLRATVELGYYVKGRFKLTASSNYPCLDDALQLFANGNKREELASTVDMAVRAMPEAIRPDLPAWVGEASQAKRIQADMARARGLAAARI